MMTVDYVIVTTSSDAFKCACKLSRKKLLNVDLVLTTTVGGWCDTDKLYELKKFDFVANVEIDDGKQKVVLALPPREKKSRKRKSETKNEP
jgi:hypothetical protein